MTLLGLRKKLIRHAHAADRRRIVFSRSWTKGTGRMHVFDTLLIQPKPRFIACADVKLHTCRQAAPFTRTICQKR